MEPITTALIAAAIGQGLAMIGKGLLEEGAPGLILEPVRQPLERLIRRGYEKAGKDKALLEAVQAALSAVGAPQDAAGYERYLLNLGFDQIQAEGNAPLRQEIARAALLMHQADPRLISDSLLRQLRWPSSRRQFLAEFLLALRGQLATEPDWAVLITCADQKPVQQYLQTLTIDMARTADAAERSAAYLRAILASRGMDPDKPDGQALAEYVNHLLGVHAHVSFLFIKPAGRRSHVRTDAELETVFVPLQVQDPESEERMQRRQIHPPAPESEEETRRSKPVTINDVLARYPVFLLKGSPGSGKTTLLRHVATCFARGQAEGHLEWTGDPLLPILIPLRNFGRFLSDHRTEFTSPAPAALREFIEDYFAEYELELPPGFFRSRLQEGRCLVLLDGLDEVADRAQRATVAQMVSAFIRHYAVRGNRFGLASRPRGYDEVADYLPGPVVCAVQPLTPESRDRLVAKLLNVLEPNAHRCREETSELLDDIRSKEKVAELSLNPLFCTTLVLVYKYRGTTLPERRVDVYHELVDLLLGFWETHKAEREGTADVRELVLLDGTGRSFIDERDAVEAKRRAMTHLADWMQSGGLSEAPQAQAEMSLASFFETREGATTSEAKAWAHNFLAVAHQRSGVFIEGDPGVYAFSHQNFREYLAATALIEQLDNDMAGCVLGHSGDPWWEEVILLAAAHPGLSSPRREFLLRQLLSAGHLIMAARCAVDAGARLPAPLRNQIQDKLRAQMADAHKEPDERYAAGEVLDELGWLPEDLNGWILCPKCADGRDDLLVMKYPITNAQFERFMKAGGYDKAEYWGGVESQMWQWRVKEHPSYRGEAPLTEPEYWHDPRFGKERRGYPVVGVSWYETVAYAAWLTDLLRRARAGDADPASEDRSLVAGLLEADARMIRLPSEQEWERVAGGAGKERYPWDPERGPATKDAAAIVARANVRESEIGGTSPVASFPLGASKPFGLMDLAGNIWEWTASWYDEKQHGARVLRGGSWNDDSENARVGVRNRNNPNNSNNNYGFRLVSHTLLLLGQQCHGSIPDAG